MTLSSTSSSVLRLIIAVAPPLFCCDIPGAAAASVTCRGANAATAAIATKPMAPNAITGARQVA